MLSRSSQTSSSTADKVSPLQEYISELELTPAGEFPDIINEESEDEEEKQGSKPTVNNNRPGSDDIIEFSHLRPYKDFDELLNQFFVIEHKKLIMIQAEIRKSRTLAKHPLLHLSALNVHDIQALREYCYQLQMVIFKSPKGREYDRAL